MPFVRISLPKMLSMEEKNQVSVSIHQSLIKEFNIPVDDYFHVIEELDSHQIKFPQNYLGVSHTEKIVYIQITAGKGRDLEKKRRLYASIAEEISKSTSVTKNNIIIVLLENNGQEDWSFGNGEIQESKHLLPTDKV
ncbi:tautomerase family protein [Chryseobacterium sp. MIQD13]|uniref:tautomerase family protein n=1 Tax=Chryseobacterium sp. MIQD13 TaxID=3422310 RepID=UPI003D2DBC09